MRWLRLLAAALVLAMAHGGGNAGANDALGAPSSSQGLDTLMGLLDEHSQTMSVQQLGELRAVMRQMSSSKQRHAENGITSAVSSPSAPPGTQESSVQRRVLPADVDMGERSGYENTELRARQVVQVYDPVNGAIVGGLLAGETYSVILYELAPFVMISDPDSAENIVLDPGNLNQTRTPSNGLISGFTIDLLETLSVELGVTLNYYFPCSKVPHGATGVCEPATAGDALNWLKSGDTDPVMQAKYYGNMTEFCPNYKCFVAAATKILAARVQDFRMTQPFMETGFVLVVNENKAAPPFMSAFDPFTFTVWMMLIVEIIVVGCGFIYVEGYGTNEALWGAPDVSELEGKAKYGAIVLGFFTQLYDAGYWATTLMLGSADKAPTTSAGRVLVTVQLFFALIFMALYTGGVATGLMNQSFISQVKTFNDFMDPTSRLFNKENTICVPASAASVASYLVTQADTLLANTELTEFKTVAGVDVPDCIKKVYIGEASAMFYDQPVVAVELTNMKMKGMCNEGGYCEDGISFEKESCEENEMEWTSVQGTMGIVGNVFNPFGYGLAFKKGTLDDPEPWDYVGFSQAIQALRESNVVAGLEKRFVPDPAKVSCTAGTSGPIQLSFTNIQGLFTLTMIILIVGLIVGMMEHIIAICVKICPCCKPSGSDEEGDEGGEGADCAEEVDEGEEEKKAEIHKRITELQERLHSIESTLGVEDAPAEEEGEANGDAKKEAADADFFGGFFSQATDMFK